MVLPQILQLHGNVNVRIYVRMYINDYMSIDKHNCNGAEAVVLDGSAVGYAISQR